MPWLAFMLSRLLAKMLLGLVAKTRVLHRERAALRGPWILAANHISHFDPPILSVAALRKLDWMAMVELFERPLVAAWLRAIESFPVDRAHVDRAAVRTALARLRSGHVVGMFPEGGIRDGARSMLQGAPPRPGVGALAQLAKVPVVPCVIIGSDRLYAPASWLPLRRVRIWIAFGEPLRCEGGGKDARRHFEARLGEAMISLFEETKNHFALTADDLPQPPARRKGRE